jgi:chaperonin GroEL
MINTTFNVEAREALKKGVDILADAVRVTLGPQGRNVVIRNPYGYPHMTKDGVSVAKEIHLRDPLENMGAQMIKEVANNTAETAGDGTTTATVLAQAIITLGLKNVTAGANPVELKKGIDMAVTALIKQLKKSSIPVNESLEQIKNVASISANNDEEMGQLIADAIEQVTTKGIITVEEAKGIDTKIEVTEGMQFDRGYMSPYFTTNQNMEAVLEDCLILISNDKIVDMKQVLPLMEKVAQAKLPLLIIADDIEDVVLNGLSLNKLKGVIKVCAVKAPGFGERRKELLEDLAILTGGNMIDAGKDLTIENVDLEDLGRAEKITVTKESTMIIGGKGHPGGIAARLDIIKALIAEAPTDFLKEGFEDRYGKLGGGVAVLYVGAPTEVEMKQKRDRVDDALAATKAAIEEGILIGGGCALIKARTILIDLEAQTFGDVNTGVKIIYDAIEYPIKQIVSNGGGEGSVIVKELQSAKKNFGYNAKTEEWEDLMKAGIIDPTKVVITALVNAASVASMLLTTECVISDDPEINKTYQQAPII